MCCLCSTLSFTQDNGPLHNRYSQLRNFVIGIVYKRSKCIIFKEIRKHWGKLSFHEIFIIVISDELRSTLYEYSMHYFFYFFKEIPEHLRGETVKKSSNCHYYRI